MMDAKAHAQRTNAHLQGALARARDFLALAEGTVKRALEDAETAGDEALVSYARNAHERIAAAKDALREREPPAAERPTDPPEEHETTNA